MSAAWVAGGVRSRAMARRRLGGTAVRQLAACGSLAAAVDVLARSPYGRDIHRGEVSLAALSRSVAETLLWNLRVLAGWLPATGAEMLRVLAGWFEIANVDEHLAGMSGRPADPPFRLGTLATVWPQLYAAGSPDEVRAVLAASPWHDPGGSTAREIQLGMRLAWAERVAARVERARPWSIAAGAVLVARERFALGRPLPAGAGSSAARLLGDAAAGAESLPEFAAALPVRARWVLAGVNEPADLWLAEARWWRRVGTDATALVAGATGGFGPDRAVGAAALLAADAWLVRGAVEAAARGGTALEVFSAVA